VDGILGHILLLSRAFLVGIPSWVGFEATTCCCLRPFWWESLRGWDFLGHNLLLSQAFLVGIPLWMGFSRPQLVVVSGLFLHDRISAIMKPFSRTFFFHGGILAITEPFLRTFFFTMEFWLSRSLSHELYFFFHDGILAIMKPFSRTFFFTMEFWLS
jgi:hypothetical protein